MEVKIFRIVNKEAGILNITENDLEELGSANFEIPTHTGDVTGDTELTIANGAVTNEKLANNSVDSDKLANNSVDNLNLADVAVRTRHIAPIQITTDKIANDAVTGDKIAALTITGENLATDSISGEKIVGSSIPGGKLALDSVTNARLANVAGSTFKGNQLTSTASPQDLDMETARAMLGINGLAVNGLSIRNANGVEKFKVAEFLEFSGGEFDAANKRLSVSASQVNTYYVDFHNGDDATGDKNNFDKPFETLDGAVNYYKTTEPPIQNTSAQRIYRFELVGRSGYSLSQRLNLPYDTGTSYFNKERVHVIISSETDASLIFNGDSTIENFSSHEGESDSSLFDSLYNALSIFIPYGQVTVNGDASLHSIGGLLRIDCKTLRHNGGVTLGGVTEPNTYIKMNKLIANTSSMIPIFQDIGLGNKVTIEQVTAFAPFQLFKNIKEKGVFEFKKITSSHNFSINQGFGGEFSGTIIHGDVFYTGAAKCNYIYAGANGTKGANIHFPKACVVEGIAAISGNSSPNHITLTGESVEYTDVSLLFEQFDAYDTAEQERIRIFLKKLVIPNDLYFSGAGISLNNTYLELGGQVIEAPTQFASVYTQDLVLLTINGQCVIKGTVGNVDRVLSGDRVNSNSVKVNINGDLLMIDGSIQDDANLDIIKSANLNRY